jgi:hypothetical protein
MNLSLYADALAPFLAEARRMLPAEAEVFDAHTHLGLDEDGRSLAPEELLAQLDEAGARRACVFRLHGRERHHGYRVSNERVLRVGAGKRRSADPVLPAGPLKSPSRRQSAAWRPGCGISCTACAGVRLRTAELEGIFAVAAQAGVPILIHAAAGCRRSRRAPRRVSRCGIRMWC